MDTKNPHQRELAGAESFDQEQQSSSSETPENSTVIDRHVVIGQGVGNLFMVSVEPAHPDHPPRIFDSHKRARGHACGVRLVTRWQIVDQTGGGK